MLKNLLKKKRCPQSCKFSSQDNKEPDNFYGFPKRILISYSCGNGIFFFKENPNLIMCVVELDKFNVQSHRVSFIIFVKVIEKK